MMSKCRGCGTTAVGRTLDRFWNWLGWGGAERDWHDRVCRRRG